MANKREADSKVTAEARVELVAIGGELLAIKARLLATANQLRAAEGTATVVDVHPEGTPFTVEGWTADLVDDPGGQVGETIDELIEGVAHAADIDAVRAEIHEYVERDREIMAGHPAGR